MTARNRGSINRANELLLEHLDEQQQATWKAHRWFKVEGKHGTYRFGYDEHVTFSPNDEAALTAGVHWNRHRRFCIIVIGNPIPQPDRLLAIKMMLETNEERLHRTAGDA